MAEKTFTIKGDIVWSAGPTELAAVKDGYLVVVDGLGPVCSPSCPRSTRTSSSSTRPVCS